MVAGPLVFDDFIIVTIPKVANTSIKATLLDWMAVPFGKNFRGDLDVHSADRFRYANKEELLGRYRKRFRIGFVRDPFTRIRSCFTNKILEAGDGMFECFRNRGCGSCTTFEFFYREIVVRSRNVHWAPQVEWLIDGSGRLVVDALYPMERIDAVWEEVMMLEFGLPPLRKDNVSRTTVVEVSDGTIDDIRRRYSADTELWRRSHSTPIPFSRGRSVI